MIKIYIILLILFLLCLCSNNILYGAQLCPNISSEDKQIIQELSNNASIINNLKTHVLNYCKIILVDKILNDNGTIDIQKINNNIIKKNDLNEPLRNIYYGDLKQFIEKLDIIKNKLNKDDAQTEQTDTTNKCELLTKYNSFIITYKDKIEQYIKQKFSQEIKTLIKEIKKNDDSSFELIDTNFNNKLSLINSGSDKDKLNFIKYFCNIGDAIIIGSKVIGTQPGIPLYKDTNTPQNPTTKTLINTYKTGYPGDNLMHIVLYNYKDEYINNNPNLQPITKQTAHENDSYKGDDRYDYPKILWFKSNTPSRSYTNHYVINYLSGTKELNIFQDVHSTLESTLPKDTKLFINLLYWKPPDKEEEIVLYKFDYNIGYINKDNKYTDDDDDNVVYKINDYNKYIVIYVMDNDNQLGWKGLPIYKTNTITEQYVTESNHKYWIKTYEKVNNIYKKSDYYYHFELDSEKSRMKITEYKFNGTDIVITQSNYK